MKIVIDARMWNETGIGRYIRNLVLGLEKLDTKNEYYLLLLPDEFENLDLGQNFHKVLADFNWYTIKEQFRLSQLLNKLSPDLFHSPNINFPVFYTGKMLVTIHDLIMLKTFEKMNVKRYIKVVLLNITLQLLRKSTVKIITVSNFVKDEIISKLRLKSSKVTVVYNSINFDNSRASFPSDNQRYLIYVGNTYGHKNVRFLIESIKQINRKLIIVGKEDVSIIRLKDLVNKLGVDHLVVFKGYVDDTELGTLYSNAFAFVFPTLDEGFGLPGLESMSYRCPVVCTKIKVLQEIYKDGALFFKQNNVADLIEKLQFLEDVDNRDKLIKKGIEVLKQYESSSFIKETLKVYYELVSYK